MNISSHAVTFSMDEVLTRIPEELITEAKTEDRFFRQLVEYWKNGSYFTYKNDLTLPMGKSFFIRVNNDGSEDLVELHYDDQSSWFITIRQVTPKGNAEHWKKAIMKGYMSDTEISTFKTKQ